MLRSVVSDFVASIKNERELDAPFMALLSAQGFFDIHFTHGSTEVGKDFIAKLKHGDEIVQYAFQNKQGDINLNTWRLLSTQLFDAIVLGLHHPGFDESLRRRGVLVTTGKIGAGVSGTIELFNIELKRRNCEPIEVWHNSRLVDLFASTDPTVMYPTDAKGLSAYGEFFGLYGRALNGEISDRDIEKHSRNWLGPAGYNDKRAFIAVVEAYTIASACQGALDTYSSCFATMAAWRAIMASVLTSSPDHQSFLTEFMKRAAAAVSTQAQAHINFIDELKRKNGGKLSAVIGGPALFVTYPIQCFRLGELLALRYYTATESSDKYAAAVSLRKLVTTEPGCHHPPSDRYAVSLVAMCRMLYDTGEVNLAKGFARDVATWVFAQYAGRSGIGGIEESDEESLFRLLGNEIEGVARPRREFSFLATALIDLAAYLNDSDLFSRLSNDLKANHMCAEYYQPADTIGQLLFEGADVVRIHNVELPNDLSDPTEYNYGPHLAGEPAHFRLSSTFGPGPLLAVSLLLRDRYFPKTWPTPT